MDDAMKLGDRHTAIMDAIHGDLLRQNPGAFVEEDGNATLVIPTKPFLTIDVSALAESVLPLAASPPAREEAPDEGAGDDRDRVIEALKRIDDGIYPSLDDQADAIFAALRNRTSEPEAGAVRRTMTINLSEAEVAALEDLIARKELDGPKIFRNSFRLYQTVEMGAASVTWHESGPLGLPYTHPAPATADKLRAAVEALEPFAQYPLAVKFDGSVAEDEYQLTGRQGANGFQAITNGHLLRARQALAALNEQPQ